MTLVIPCVGGNGVWHEGKYMVYGLLPVSTSCLAAGLEPSPQSGFVKQWLPKHCVCECMWWSRSRGFKREYSHRVRTVRALRRVLEQTPEQMVGLWNIFKCCTSGGFWRVILLS